MPTVPVGEDPVLAALWTEREERDAARARARLAQIDVTAQRIVRDQIGTDNIERDERKRQKLYKYGSTGQRSQEGKDKQTFRRVQKHIRQWDGMGGYREKSRLRGSQGFHSIQGFGVSGLMAGKYLWGGSGSMAILMGGDPGGQQHARSLNGIVVLIGSFTSLLPELDPKRARTASGLFSRCLSLSLLRRRSKLLCEQSTLPSDV